MLTLPFLQGVRMVFVEECWHKSLSPLMDAVRKEFKDTPTYISFDIDAIDPCLCPGTGMASSQGPPPAFHCCMLTSWEWTCLRGDKAIIIVT